MYARNLTVLEGGHMASWMQLVVDYLDGNQLGGETLVSTSPYS